MLVVCSVFDFTTIVLCNEILFIICFVPAEVVDFGSLNRFKHSIKLVDLSKFLTVDINT